MRVCIVGAGAIGGLMGAKLALSGEEVTVIDQGAHLEAIKENGLKLIWEDGTEYVAEVAKATDNLEEAGEQDLIILGLKAHYLDQVAKEISLITGPETMIDSQSVERTAMAPAPIIGEQRKRHRVAAA